MSPKATLQRMISKSPSLWDSTSSSVRYPQRWNCLLSNMLMSLLVSVRVLSVSIRETCAGFKGTSFTYGHKPMFVVGECDGLAREVRALPEYLGELCGSYGLLRVVSVLFGPVDAEINCVPSGYVQRQHHRGDSVPRPAKSMTPLPNSVS